MSLAQDACIQDVRLKQITTIRNRRTDCSAHNTGNAGWWTYGVQLVCIQDAQLSQILTIPEPHEECIAYCTGSRECWMCTIQSVCIPDVPRVHGTECLGANQHTARNTRKLENWRIQRDAVKSRTAKP